MAKIDQLDLTPLQQKLMQELEMAQLMASEILAQACWRAASVMPPEIVRSYRGEAHKRMEAILNHVELVMMQCQGRA